MPTPTPAPSDAITVDPANPQASLNQAWEQRRSVRFLPQVYTVNTGIDWGDQRGWKARIYGQGATIVSRNPRAPVFLIAAAEDLEVYDLTLRHADARTRMDNCDGLRVLECRALKLSRITVEETTAAGILIWNSVGVTADTLTARNTLADGVHFTCCSDVVASNLLTEDTGDDGIAVLSDSTGPQTARVTIDGFTVRRSESRGISLLSGDGITYRNGRVEGSRMAGVYIVPEDTFDLKDILQGTVENVIIADANSVGAHAGIFVSSWNDGATPTRHTHNVTLRNLTVDRPHGRFLYAGEPRSERVHALTVTGCSFNARSSGTRGLQFERVNGLTVQDNHMNGSVMGTPIERMSCSGLAVSGNRMNGSAVS